MTAAEPTGPKESATRSLLSRFRQLTFWNKLATIGSVASVVSIPLAIYFFIATIQTRDLMYRTFWDTWIVHTPGSSSKLSWVYAGQPLEDRVFLKQIAIWNEGQQSIRPENVLAPVVLVASPSVTVLDATVIDVTRNVVNFRIDTTDLENGRIPVSWDILEHKDGALLQVVCIRKASALADLSFTVEGTVEGQRTIRSPLRTHFGDSLITELWSLFFYTLLMFCGGVSFVLALTEHGRKLRKRLFLNSLFVLTFGTLYGWMAFNAVFDWPPFSMR